MPLYTGLDSSFFPTDTDKFLLSTVYATDLIFFIISSPLFVGLVPKIAVIFRFILTSFFSAIFNFVSRLVYELMLASLPSPSASLDLLLLRKRLSLLRLRDGDAGVGENLCRRLHPIAVSVRSLRPVRPVRLRPFLLRKCMECYG